jgi:hypothetical protein
VALSRIDGRRRSRATQDHLVTIRTPQGKQNGVAIVHCRNLRASLAAKIILVLVCALMPPQLDDLSAPLALDSGVRVPLLI